MIGSTTWKNFPLTRYARLIIPSVILAVVSGCSSAKIIQESVVVRDTVIVTKERKLVDTLMLFKDTTIYQDRVKVKIEYRDNYVKIEADCPSDTIRVTQVKVVQSKQEKSNMTLEKLIGWTITILLMLIIIRTIISKLI